jgi:hypothetical protein
MSSEREPEQAPGQKARASSRSQKRGRAECRGFECADLSALSVPPLVAGYAKEDSDGL